MRVAENDLMQQVQSAQLTHFQQSTGEDDWAASYRSIDQARLECGRPA